MIANLARQMSKLDVNQTAYKKKMDQITSYMNCRLFPTPLQKQIKQFYKHYLSQKTALDEKAILNELPTNLRQEAVLHLIHETVLRVNIFEGQGTIFSQSLRVVLKTN